MQFPALSWGPAGVQGRRHLRLHEFLFCAGGSKRASQFECGASKTARNSCRPGLDPQYNASYFLKVPRFESPGAQALRSRICAS